MAGDIEMKPYTTDGGEVKERYCSIKTIKASILNDAGSDNNQSSSTSFNRGVNYSDTTRFYLRYLPLAFNNNNRKKFKVTWNHNDYFIVNMIHVSNRSATILTLSTSV